MAVTVRVRAVTMRLAMVVMARRRRHMMIGAQRSVQREGKRRHDRQTGRETPAQQLGETNHPRTGITLHQHDSSHRVPASPERPELQALELRIFGGIR